jgi:integrase
MAKHSDHLWKRGGQWYFRMVVPRPLHSRIVSDGGKHIHMITKALGDSESQARRKRDRLVVICGELFDRARDGETITADQVKAAIEIDLGAITERIRAEMLDSFHRATPRDVVVQYGAYGSLKPTPDADLFVTIAELAKREGVKIEPGTALWDSIATTITRARNAAYAEAILLASGSPGASPMTTVPAPAQIEASPETINQAAEAWFAEMQRDPRAAVQPQTLEGHKAHVREAVKYFGDVALTDITPAKASDFLANVAKDDRSNRNRSNRTINQYGATLAKVFKAARLRGRFAGQNPFEGQRRKAGGQKYAPFTMPELESLFGSFTFELAPKQHTPESALPWAALIGLYSGLRLEEIAQLDVADIHPQGGIMVFEIHNGARNHLKNETSVRSVPVHSELIRLGLLRYRDSLPTDGLLFPGLKRRASKDNKLGARLGELFRKKLVALEIKQKAEQDNRRVCFHSLRKNAGGAMERGGAAESDAGRVLGHALGMTFGTYSQAVLERMQETVERIRYEGLKIPAAKPSAKRR